jgi:hypothetical protein
VSQRRSQRGKGKPARSRWWKAAVALGLVVAFTAILAWRPAAHLAGTALSDRDTRVPPPPGTVDDAGRMSGTKVAEIVTLAALAPETAAAEK